LGYARVSTQEQHLDLQKAALTRYGVDRTFEEKVSAVSSKRFQLELILKELVPGDEVVVWRLDRLARNLEDLIGKIKQIEDAGATLVSLTERIDMKTASGRLLVHIFGAVAEFERAIIRERTTAGLKVLKDRGVKLGAEKKLSPQQIDRARAMLMRTGKRSKSVMQVAKEMGVSHTTLYDLGLSKRKLFAPQHVRK